MKYIVGLGNPGNQYAATKHNVGFMAVDLLADKWNISTSHNKFKSHCGEGQINGNKVTLIKPQTYMNLSGEAVKALMEFYKADMKDLMIIYDDLDTAFGHIRLRYQGSPGGHNGIKSLVQHLGTTEFNRIRIGISRPAPGYDIADYVLAPFAKADVQSLGEILKLTLEAIEYAVENPFDKAMAKYNKKE
ncbi:MAG TPA: aminoacyl-tRNA hydrolase [Bacilli bacterium]